MEYLESERQRLGSERTLSEYHLFLPVAHALLFRARGLSYMCNINAADAVALLDSFSVSVRWQTPL